MSQTNLREPSLELVSGAGDLLASVVIGDLTFPSINFGSRATPWDLRRFVYVGGAGVSPKMLNIKIQSGEFGMPSAARVELVQKIHEILSRALAGGGTIGSLGASISTLKLFFFWADETNRALSLESIQAIFREWTDSLLHRVRIVKDISEGVAYGYAKVIGSILSQIFEIGYNIAKTTRLRCPKKKFSPVGNGLEKQNLEDAFEMGRFLLDVADGLSVNSISGDLPVHIKLRVGKELVEWSGLTPPGKIKFSAVREYDGVGFDSDISELRKKYIEDKTLRTRFSLVNLRIQVEMFMLMAQPGINLTQAHRLRMGQWRFKPSVEGYEIRAYKNRRWGAVAFTIYSEYRQVFDSYLKWRESIFPDDPEGLLFPLQRRGGGLAERVNGRPPTFERLKDACERAGVKYLPPSTLRMTNVNWMLRRTQDVDITANEKQHSVKTLLSSYEKPSLQRAMVQISRFWAKNDPTKVAVGPGICERQMPEPVDGKPAEAKSPDCTTPAGCLFCAQQRDVDSFDHVWSLASFRLLKSFELSGQMPPGSGKNAHLHPAEAAIFKITEKLNLIQSLGEQRREWVKEALLRIEEGRYHPSWAELIESL